MKETIVELKIKGYHVAIDNESTIITKDDETLLKVEHKHIKAMIEFITQKINQIKKQIETKE